MLERRGHHILGGCVVSGGMDTTMINDFQGTLLQAGDEGYADSANTHYTTGSPKLVARPPHSAADVAAAVRYATAEGLEVSVRAGGHGTSGMSTNDGGLVIDLTALDSVELLDAATHRVRIGGGAVWGHVAEELAKHGLALTSGDTGEASESVDSRSGAASVGWCALQGLALDSLVEAEVVLADGSDRDRERVRQPRPVLGASRGGGNFGAVTAFTFEAHPLQGIVHGSIQLEPEQLPAVLRGWRDAMRSAPRELTTIFLSLPAFGPDAPPSMQIEVCWAVPTSPPPKRRSRPARPRRREGSHARGVRVPRAAGRESWATARDTDRRPQRVHRRAQRCAGGCAGRAAPIGRRGSGVPQPRGCLRRGAGRCHGVRVARTARR